MMSLITQNTLIESSTFILVHALMSVKMSTIPQNKILDSVSLAQCGAFLASPIIIGDLRVDNRLFSAPMSGLSDLPFQALAHASGAGLVFSEMAASNLLTTKNTQIGCNQIHIKDKLLSSAPQSALTSKSLSAVQIFGRDPDAMRTAALMAEEEGAALIDINMGCPAKKLASKHSKNGEVAACGSALMRDEELALEIINAVVSAVCVPVSVKMRLGWDETTINAPVLAAEAVRAGIEMITVHARTRSQFYKGHADWAKVKAVRIAMDEAVPNKVLIINGDIHDLSSAAAALKASQADGVMVGRASSGEPWLVGGLDGEKHPKDLKNYILNHYRSMLSFYGEVRGVRHARKHLDWYLQKHYKGFYTPHERAALMSATTAIEAEDKLLKILTRAA